MTSQIFDLASLDNFFPWNRVPQAEFPLKSQVSKINLILDGKNYFKSHNLYLKKIFINLSQTNQTVSK